MDIVDREYFKKKLKFSILDQQIFEEYFYKHTFYDYFDNFLNIVRKLPKEVNSYWSFLESI